MPFPNVYPWIRQCLQDSAPASGPCAVADAYFDPTIRSALRDAIPASVIAQAGAVDRSAFYDALAGDDEDIVNEAVGLMVSARLIGPLSTGGANGQLLSEKTETVSRTFSNGPGNKEEWEERAASLLAQCSFAPKSSELFVGGFFAANGPSRAREAEG